MKYNNTFREALKKVREAPDHEISMARGELKATLNVTVHKFTATAKAAIEAAGGEVVTL